MQRLKEKQNPSQMTFTLSEILDVVKGTVFFSNPDISIKSFTTDSRRAKEGDCFIALKGDRFNGAAFANDAYDLGAQCFIVDRKMLSAYPDSDDVLRKVSGLPNLVVVENTYRALLDLARVYRSRFPVRTVAITGSCGKTTTKEIVTFLLSENYSVLSNQGNLNNRVGVPITVFNLQKKHQFLVSELGASSKGEIARLASVVKPEIGVVLNVHPAHLEGFGDLPTVYRTKLELAEHLNHSDGQLITCGDDDVLRSLAHSFKGRVILFGRHKDCDVRLTKLERTGDGIVIQVNNEHSFSLKTRAPFNAINVLAGLAVAYVAGIPLDSLQDRLQEFTFPKGRFEELELSSGMRVFFDAYNANPSAFREAVGAFKNYACEGRKVVVCGDMLELGDQSEHFHHRLGEGLATSGFDGVVTIGQWSGTVLKGLRAKSSDCIFARSFEKKEAASEFLRSVLRPNDQILIKGSRSLELETIVNDLKKMRKPTAKAHK